MSIWPPPNRGVAVVQGLVVATIAWGALAFGAVYPWAYWPLGVACAICGMAALIATATANVDGTSGALNGALVAVAAAICLQLVPIPARVLSELSPGTPALVARLNPAFAVGLQPIHAASVWPRDTYVALILYASFALLCVGLASLFSVTGTRRFVECLTALGALLAIIGFVQRSLSSRYLYGFWELEAGRTPFGPFVNRNHFAGWMAMALPMTLGLLVAGIDQGMRGVKRGWRHRVLWFASPEANRLILAAAAAVLMALSLMLTMSRSGMTAFGLSMLVTGWFVSQSVHSRSRRIVATICLVLLAATVIVWSGPDVIANRFAAADWGEFNNRKGAWLDAWSVARAFPLVGTGLNTYWAAALFYQQHDMSYFFAQAHNDYLQLAAEGGLLVAVPAIVCLVVFVRDVRRSLHGTRGETSWWLRAGAVVSLIAIGFQEGVDFSLQMPGNAALFAAVCGVALHSPTSTSENVAKTIGASNAAPRHRPLRIVGSVRSKPGDPVDRP
ncbi:MAG TPA: O-antigen ligase family protein [Vicinamibacterales bacterium]